MTENTNISTSGHQQGNIIMVAGKFSQRQIDWSLKLGQARQEIIKEDQGSEFKVDDRLLVLFAPDFDDSNGAKPRLELLL